MQKSSVGLIFDLKCEAGKKDVFMKIDSDDLPIGQVELLQIRSKIGTFADIVIYVQNRSCKSLTTIHMNIDERLLILSSYIISW